MAASAFLFDLDGTIWNSIPYYARALARGNEKATGDFESHLRSGLSVVTLAKRHHVPEAEILRLLTQQGQGLLYPNVARVLGKLAGRNVPLGIVTGLPGRLATPVVEACRISGYFTAFVHRGNCRSKKPSAEPIRMAMRAAEIDDSKAVVYVGDRDEDAKAAANAGIAFAWASYGYGSQCPEGAGVVLRSFEELLKL